MEIVPARVGPGAQGVDGEFPDREPSQILDGPHADCHQAHSICWSCILSSCHLAAQSLAPTWVRARAMSVYLFCFFGAASFGSHFWGYLATALGLRPCLLLSAALLALAAFSTRRAPLMTALRNSSFPDSYGLAPGQESEPRQAPEWFLA